MRPYVLYNVAVLWRGAEKKKCFLIATVPENFVSSCYRRIMHKCKPFGCFEGFCLGEDEWESSSKVCSLISWTRNSVALQNTGSC